MLPVHKEFANVYENYCIAPLNAHMQRWYKEERCFNANLEVMLNEFGENTALDGDEVQVI